MLFLFSYPNVIEAMSWLIDECFFYLWNVLYSKQKKKKKKGRLFAIFATLLWICSHLQTFLAHSIPRKLETWLIYTKD